MTDTNSWNNNFFAAFKIKLYGMLTLFWSPKISAKKSLWSSMKFLRSVEGIVNFTISNLSADFTELTIFWKQNVWTHLQKMEWVDLDAQPSLWLHQWNAPVEKRVDLRNGVGLNVTLSKIPSQWSSLEYNTLLHLSPLYSCEARTYLLKKMHSERD